MILLTMKQSINGILIQTKNLRLITVLFLIQKPHQIRYGWAQAISGINSILAQNSVVWPYGYYGAGYGEIGVV